MKNNWKFKRLGDVCQIELGKTPFRENPKFWDPEKQTGNVWLSIADLLNTDGDIINDSKEYISDKGAELCKIVKKWTLLASFKLTLGRLAFAGKDLFTNEAIAALTIKNEKEITKEYLYHFLTFFDWHGEVKGDVKVKGKTLNKAKLKEIKIIFPDALQEQHRIVKILDEVFGSIAKAKANTEKNLQNTKELFESCLQGVFANPGKDWGEKRVGEILRLEYGKPLDKKFRNPSGKYPAYGANGEKARTDKFYCDRPSIIVGRKGSAGELNLTESKYWPLDVTYFVDFDNKKYLLQFIYYLLTTLKLTKLAKGVKPGINRNDVYEIPISVPKMSVQKSIVTKLDALSAQTKKLEAIYQQKLADLDELKKSVLKKAFAGEL